MNGFYGSLVVNKRNNHILAGNHRFLAARDLGYKTVPVTWVDVGEREEKRILLADNKTGDLGLYDNTILTDLLKELDDEGMLEGTGYTDGDLKSLILGVSDFEESSVEEGDGVTEYDADDFDNFDHQCPRCGFEWNDV